MTTADAFGRARLTGRPAGGGWRSSSRPRRRSSRDRRHLLLPAAPVAALAAAGIEAPKPLCPLVLTAVLVATTVPIRFAARLGARRSAAAPARSRRSSSRSPSRPATSPASSCSSRRPRPLPARPERLRSIYFTLLGADHAHVAVGMLLELWFVLRLARGLTRYRLVGLQVHRLLLVLRQRGRRACRRGPALAATVSAATEHRDAAVDRPVRGAARLGGAARRRLRRRRSLHCDAGGTGFGSSIVAWETVVTAGAVLLSLCGQAAAVDRAGATRAATGCPTSAARFFADAAVLANVLFMLVILLERDHRRDRGTDVSPVVIRLALIVSATLALALAASAALPPAGIVLPDRTAGTPPRQLGLELYAGELRALPRQRRRRHPGDQGRRCAASARCAADFYLRTGYMPLAPHGRAAAPRAASLLRRAPDRALVAYVASLGHGPPIPTPAPAARRRSPRACASSPSTAPAATRSSAAGRLRHRRGARRRSTMRRRRQIAEAVRIGPYVMPRFSQRAICDRAARLDRRVRRATRSIRDDPAAGRSATSGRCPRGSSTWLIAGGGARRALPR